MKSQRHYQHTLLFFLLLVLAVTVFWLEQQKIQSTASTHFISPDAGSRSQPFE